MTLINLFEKLSYICFSKGVEIHLELLRAEDLEGGGDLVVDKQLAVRTETLVVDRHLHTGPGPLQPPEGVIFLL